APVSWHATERSVLARPPNDTIGRAPSWASWASRELRATDWSAADRLPMPPQLGAHPAPGWATTNPSTTCRAVFAAASWNEYRGVSVASTYGANHVPSTAAGAGCRRLRTAYAAPATAAASTTTAIA